MELKKIEISNFRSIKRVDINIKEVNGKRCLILLGKNEAGKSNILKAVEAIFGKYQVSTKDQRKSQDKDNIEEGMYFICAIFKLDQKDIAGIYNDFIAKFMGVELIEFATNLSLEAFIGEVFSEILLRIDIDNGSKPYMIHREYQGDTSFTKQIFLNENLFSEVKNGEAVFSIADLMKEIFKIIDNKWNPLSLFQCEKWHYSKEYLLPEKVKIEDFKNNPDSCVPLKKLFFLGKQTDIVKAIDRAYRQDEGLYNLLDNISKRSTEEFCHAWRDLGNDVGFSLSKDGESIYIHIRDQLRFSMEARSDGFQHFVSMLLAFSAEHEDKCYNKILLLDEPETHLYPISVKNLRDHLLKISQQSLVIYSTHSPYMIDDMAIDNDCRHLIIEKEKGITSIYRPDRKSNYIEDELLLRAIGCSIFERIKSKNMLFEGYNDYSLFMKHRNEDKFKDYGALYLQGIGDIKNIVPLIMLTRTKFYIVADSDDASKNQKKNFEENFPDYANCWLEYRECGEQYKTLEDFYESDFVKQVMSDDYVDFIPQERDMLKSIKECIKKKIDEDTREKCTEKEIEEEIKQRVRKVKNRLVEQAEQKNLKQGYMKFLKVLEKKMKDL